MKNYNYLFLFLFFFFLFMGCKDDINKPIYNPGTFYKVEGIVLFNSIPLEDIDVFLDTLKCRTDSLGYFVFDSLKSQTSSLHINYPQYVPVDTLLNITQNFYLNLNIVYRTDSFYPLSIGNKWFFNNLWEPIPDSTKHELIVEVIGSELIGNKNYFKLLNTTFTTNLADTFRSYTYVMVDGDSLYESQCGQVGLLAPFNISVSDTFIYQGCVASYYGTLIENTEDKFKYYYKPTGLALDARFVIHFQKGIGIIKQYSAWQNYELDKYEIR